MFLLFLFTVSILLGGSYYIGNLPDKIPVIKKNSDYRIAQQLAYSISNNCQIINDVIYIPRKGALAILDRLKELKFNKDK